VELVELDLSYGGVLEQLPDDVFLSLKKLETLYLGGNQLKVLPPSLFDPENGSGASLMHLDVHGNALKTMPPAIGCCTALLSLNLGRNQLRTLPSELAMCSDLRSLQVYENDLQLPLPEAFQTAYLHLGNFNWRGNPAFAHVPAVVERQGLRALLTYFTHPLAAAAASASHRVTDAGRS
jgi:CCR4-NOT transcription complex subunit 6